MNLKQKLELIKRNSEEIISEKELNDLLKNKSSPVVYCGYEPSGPLHLGHLVTITKLLDLEKAGFKIIILLADIHALLNKKGKESEIKKQVQIWKKTLKLISPAFRIILGSDFQFKQEYQLDVMKLAQQSTINRGLRSMQEIARDVKNATISQLLYPLMQVVDIKALKVDVALGGLEQRKVHMIGKDMSKTLNYSFIAIHTPLITSLKGPGEKMSGSSADSLISLIDSKDKIEKAIKSAYCPAKEIKDNPVLQISRLLIFPRANKIDIKRPEKFGGNKSYNSYEELEKDFAEGKLHPADLKQAVTSNLVKILSSFK